MDIGKIESDIAELDGLSGDDKLSRARLVLTAVAEAEAATNFAIPAEVVSRLKVVIPIIQDTVSRLESGKRRRDANAEAKRED